MGTILSSSNIEDDPTNYDHFTSIPFFGRQNTGSTVFYNQLCELYRTDRNHLSKPELMTSKDEISSAILSYVHHLNYKLEENTPNDIYNKIVTIVATDEFKKLHKATKNDDLQLYTTMEYFLSKCDKMDPHFYIPTFRDRLMVYVPTERSSSRPFFHKYRFIDHGGILGGRYSWLSETSDQKTSGCIFFASLIDYCRSTDANINALEESLELFERVINSKHFKDKEIVLCLTKPDLFGTVLATNPFKHFFPGYFWGNSETQVLKHIIDMYLDQNRFDRSRVHIHVLNTLDTCQVYDEFEKMAKILCPTAKDFNVSQEMIWVLDHIIVKLLTKKSLIDVEFHFKDASLEQAQNPKYKTVTKRRLSRETLPELENLFKKE